MVFFTSDCTTVFFKFKFKFSKIMELTAESTSLTKRVGTISRVQEEVIKNTLKGRFVESGRINMRNRNSTRIRLHMSSDIDLFMIYLFNFSGN